MTNAKHTFFQTINFKCHSLHGNMATILYLTSEYDSLSLLCQKLYFLEIAPVHQKLWSFKCTMLKKLNSNFLNWEDTLTHIPGQPLPNNRKKLMNKIIRLNHI